MNMTMKADVQHPPAAATPDVVASNEISQLAQGLSDASINSAAAEDALRPGQVVPGLPSPHYVFLEAAFREAEKAHTVDTVRLALAVARP